MPSETSISNNQEISIDQLKPGMYVLSISYQDKGFILKSEGYVLSVSKILQMKDAGIKKVIIDPQRTKATETIDKVLPNISSKPMSHLARKSKPAITLEQEMQQAKKLYDNAKHLQTKILQSVKTKQPIDAQMIKETSDEMVDSIFRNQDALTCLSRFRNKSDYLKEHALNCSIYMTVFAKHLKLDRATIEQLALGAFLHDIGKILVPNKILNKKGALDAKEQSLVRSHVALGAKYLESTPHISHIVMTLVREHHERVDGSGYPKQLKDEDLSKFSKMMAIVDSYDAMTAERVYKDALHPIAAFKDLVKESGTLYDEELVDKFIQCLGVYPVGTLVKLNSGKVGLISQLNYEKPTLPMVKVFYNTRLNQAISIEDIDLTQSKYKDQIDRCIKPEEFNLNLMGFFKTVFMDS